MTDRANRELNELIEGKIEAWRGTPTGVILRAAYKGEISYRGLLEIIGLDPADFSEVQ